MNLSEMIYPGQTIGIIGGGQLGQMMTFAAKSMGYRVGILDPVEDCSAAQVADWQIVAHYDDTHALKKFAENCDVLTYEFENVDVAALQEVAKIVKVPQGIELLTITQDRLLEKAFLESENINIAPYSIILSLKDIEEAIDSIGFPCVLKTTRGGYDGKGQHVMYSLSDITGCLPLIQTGVCVLEAWVPFEKEISIMVAGNDRGEIVTFPLAENIHRQNILHQTIVPARVPEEVVEEAQRVAEMIAVSLNIRGVLGIEMFVTESGGLYVNELAPRPHNSGHFTIEACNTSQFEAHIRGICNWPLAPLKLLSPAVMVNVLGEHFLECVTLIQNRPDWHFHFYNKGQAKEGRKMGHITILTEELNDTLANIIGTNIWN